jgi:hypothetical protein
MTLQEIKKAIQEGLTVCWKQSNYEVQKSIFNGDYNIVCISNNNDCIGLTWLDGSTMNGKEEDFYIKDCPIVSKDFIDDEFEEGYINLNKGLTDMEFNTDDIQIRTYIKCIDRIVKDLESHITKNYKWNKEIN